MGQRTAFIVVAQDHDKNTIVRAYHNQWGIGRKTPLAFMSLFTRLYNREYGKKITECAFIDQSEHKMSLEYQFDYPTGKELAKVHDTSCGPENEEIYTRQNKGFGNWKDVPKKVEGWRDPAKVQKYIYGNHDNNNGAIVVFVTPADGPEWDVPKFEIGWLVGEEDEDDAKLAGLPLNDWVTTEPYLSLPVNEDFSDDKFRAMFRSFLDYFGVKELQTKDYPFALVEEGKKPASDTASE